VLGERPVSTQQAVPTQPETDRRSPRNVHRICGLRTHAMPCVMALSGSLRRCHMTTACGADAPRAPTLERAMPSLVRQLTRAPPRNECLCAITDAAYTLVRTAATSRAAPSMCSRVRWEGSALVPQQRPGLRPHQAVGTSSCFCRRPRRPGLNRARSWIPSNLLHEGRAKATQSPAPAQLVQAPAQVP
jgi:hypothetical protein